MPVGGGPVSTPTTGPPPNVPSLPDGALPQPVSPTTGSSGMMPIGMPLGGLAGVGEEDWRREYRPCRSGQAPTDPAAETSECLRRGRSGPHRTA
jgi:hypothetical protein